MRVPRYYLFDSYGQTLFIQISKLFEFVTEIILNVFLLVYVMNSIADIVKKLFSQNTKSVLLENSKLFV